MPFAGNRARAICIGGLLVWMFVPSSLVGQNNITYQIDGSFDAATNVLSATVSISGHERAIRNGSLHLDMPFPSAVTVHGVTGTGSESLSYEGSPTGESLVIDVPAATGNEEVRVAYSIQVESDPEPFGYHLFSDPLGTRWYPKVLDGDGESDRFSDFVVRLDLPDSFGLLSTGGYGDRQVGGGRVVSRYLTERVQDFAIAAGAGFVVAQHLEGEVPLYAFYHPDNADRFSTVAARTGEALQWYAEIYGFFPGSFMGIVQGHPRWGGGFPMSNMFMVHLGNLNDDFLAFITAHELGHYYWGLHVLGDREYLDWLALANGIWADQLYLAERSGRTLEEQWRYVGNGDWMLDLMSAMVSNREQRLDLTRQEEEEAGLDFDYNSLVRHGKGATGVFLQSQLVGYESFLALQRKILDRYRHRPLPVEHFVALLDSIGSEDALAFFDFWRRGDARIDAAIDRIDELEETGQFQVTITRTGNVPFPIDYEVDLEGGGMVRQRLLAEAGADTVRTTVRPLAVRFDPDGVIPMPGSSHPGIRRLWLVALYLQDLNESFVPLALAHLVSFPEDHTVRYRLAHRLYSLGRWEEGAALWTSRIGCGDPDQCRAAIYAARSMGKLGQVSDAKEALALLAEGAREHGLESLFDTVRDEVGGGAP